MTDRDKNPAGAGWLMLGFVLLNLGAKGLMMRINLGEYTDGILQLNVFSIKSGLYPPLYGGLAWLVSRCGLELETAGRIVSVIAGSLAVIPILLMTRSLYGTCAAKFAAILYTISPLLWRWSVRVMTDSLFLCVSAFSLYFMFLAWSSAHSLCASARGADVDGSSSPHDRARTRDKYLALASLFGVLATLTRYQGALLGILMLIPLAAFVAAFRRVPVRAIIVSLLWIAVPAWVHYAGFVHGEQFASRQAGSYGQTLLAYWNLAESFMLISPYYFAYPIFAFFLIGLLRSDILGREMRAFTWLWFLWGAGLLAAQSAFGSFQYRYMMPVLPAVLILAGGGCAKLESALMRRGKYALFSGLFMLAVILTTLFSCAVLVLQRKTFGDQRAAADYIKSSVPAGARVFSNERYGNFTKLGCVKLSFWSGRQVESLLEYAPDGNVRFREIPAGSFLILCNSYGGDEQLDFVERRAAHMFNLREVASFDAEIYPLMDDIMVSPIMNQNPLAWVMRYTPQDFSTHVFKIDSLRDVATSPTVEGKRP